MVGTVLGVKWLEPGWLVEESGNGMGENAMGQTCLSLWTMAENLDFVLIAMGVHYRFLTWGVCGEKHDSICIFKILLLAQWRGGVIILTSKLEWYLLSLFKIPIHC